MSWLATAIVAVLTAVVGTLASGFVANLAVRWYHISGFEGLSGYFVVALALGGLVAGLLIGVVASRTVGGGSDPSAVRAFGASLGVLLSIVGLVGGTARLLADVPPEIDGETLMLAVEVRWPESQASSPATETEEGQLQLNSVTRFSHVQRASTTGPLWKTDARMIEGRWVVPGAVDIFTNRGTRSLDVVLDGTTRKGFLLPLTGNPTREDMRWSEWFPHARAGAPPLPDDFSYRYRVQRRSEPVRTEAVGPFEVSTIAAYFFTVEANGKNTFDAAAEFALRHRGQPLVIEGKTSATGEAMERFERVAAVAALPGASPALLVVVARGSEPAACFLVTEVDDRVRVEFVANTAEVLHPTELTMDSARFRSTKTHHAFRGRFDRTSFDREGLFLLGDAVLDTRNRSVYRFDAESDAGFIPSVPPLALSPDERSFVRFANDPASDGDHVLAVTDFVGNRAYTLPVDQKRMRFATFDVLDPTWLAHHFAWERDGNGVDRLVEREGFVPIPYQGQLSVENDGYRAYRLEPAGDSLRDALIEFLVAELKAERMPVEDGADEHPMRIDGQIVNVAGGYSGRFVTVSTPRGAPGSGIVTTIAQRFDSALATGKYDSLFGK